MNIVQVNLKKKTSIKLNDFDESIKNLFTIFVTKILTEMQHMLMASCVPEIHSYHENVCRDRQNLAVVPSVAPQKWKKLYREP